MIAIPVAPSLSIPCSDCGRPSVQVIAEATRDDERYAYVTKLTRAECDYHLTPLEKLR